MANGHGGARRGSGRKPNAEKYPEEVKTFHDGAAAHMPQLLDNLTLLADGGYEQVTETWEPAGLMFVDAPVVGADGKPLMDANGRPIIVKQLAFPDKPADELVCVRRSRSIAAPDRKANEYLVDRVAGRPTQAIEGDVGLTAGDELLKAFGESIAKIYGEEGA